MKNYKLVLVLFAITCTASACHKETVNPVETKPWVCKAYSKDPEGRMAVLAEAGYGSDQNAAQLEVLNSCRTTYKDTPIAANCAVQSCTNQVSGESHVYVAL